MARWLYGGLTRGTGATPFEGELVAPLVPELQAAQDQFSGFEGGDQFDELSAAAVERALSGEPSFDVSDEATAERFERGVAAPLRRDFETNIAPLIDESFASRGGSFSSRRGEARARALTDISLRGQSILAGQQQENQQLQAALSESAANRQMAGVGLAEQVSMAPLLRSQALTTTGAPFQLYEQSLRDAQYSEFLRMAPENNPYVQAALGYLNVQTLGLRPRNTRNLDALSGAISGAGFGGGGGGGGMGSMMSMGGGGGAGGGMGFGG